jgi:hypothetical protein
MRVQQPNMTASQLHVALIKDVRSEFEHNLSQQLYLSTQAWELVKKAKEDMSKLINTAASELQENATGNNLSQKIFELTTREEKLPTTIAIDFVKNEINKIF